MNNPETVPAGQTRIVPRKRAAEDGEKEQAIEKHNRKEVEESTATDLKMKEGTIVGMKGAAIKQRVETMATSVEMMATSVEMFKKQIDSLQQTTSGLRELMTKMDDRKLSGEDLMAAENVRDGDGNEK